MRNQAQESLSQMSPPKPGNCDRGKRAFGRANLICRVALFLAGLALLAGRSAGADADAPKRLAILIGSPWEGESDIHNDLTAIYQALRQRGFAPEEILSLEGSLSRQSLLPFLQIAGRSAAGWRSGKVFLYFSGHGNFTGTTVPTAQPGLQLTGDPKNPDTFVLWKDAIAALSLPPGVELFLLPDCCFINLLAGRLPSDVVAISVKAPPGTDLQCHVQKNDFEMNGSRVERGVISYYAGQTLPQATTFQSWVESINHLAEADIRHNRMKRSKWLTLRIVGDPAAGIPGAALAQAAH